LLNDTVFMESSQALGRLMAARSGNVRERILYLFERCLSRAPDQEELAMMMEFYEAQHRRFEGGELDAGKVAGAGEGDSVERATWTTLARAILNLDEAITKG